MLVQHTATCTAAIYCTSWNIYNELYYRLWEENMKLYHNKINKFEVGSAYGTAVSAP